MNDYHTLTYIVDIVIMLAKYILQLLIWIVTASRIKLESITNLNLPNAIVMGCHTIHIHAITMERKKNDIFQNGMRLQLLERRFRRTRVL